MFTSVMARALALLVCLLAVSPYPTFAQHQQTRVLPVTVLAADGRPIPDLQLRNIHVHGKAVHLNSFVPDTSPRRIVLLFDTSGSMAISNGRVTLLQAAIHTAGLFLDRVPSGDLISVYAFADKSRELVPFTHDLAAIRSAMNDLTTPDVERAGKKYGTGTDLGNVLNSILTLLSANPQFADTIVVFSDGLLPRSNGSNIMAFYDQPDYLERITPSLGTLGVRVFFSLAGNVEGAPPLHGVEQFIGATGGESFELNDSGPSFYGGAYDHPEAPVYRSNSLERRALVLFAAIQDTYRLQLQFTSPLEKPTRLHLDFVDGQGKALHNVTVLSPEFVYPDAATHR
jgi:VWA domain-containing protein